VRLSTAIKDQIIQYARHYFGDDIRIYLFGSRVDDDKKGGDIDILIENNKDMDMQIQIAFLKDIYKHVTQRKVDLLVKSPSTTDKPVFHTARREGVLLC